MSQDEETRALVNEVYAAFERMLDNFTRWQDSVTELEMTIERLKDAVKKP
jgi:cell division septum initiation protein DivIVA